jgi:hypothetical protein
MFHSYSASGIRTDDLFFLSTEALPRSVAAGLTSPLASERTGQREPVAGPAWQGHL